LLLLALAKAELGRFGVGWNHLPAVYQQIFTKRNFAMAVDFYRIACITACLANFLLVKRD
jgi:hypothetical protein